jgi:hypothetical protein
MSRRVVRGVRRHRRVAVAIGVAVVLAACGSDGGNGVTIPNVYDLAHDPTTGISPVPDDRGEVMPADELRNALERDLAWHGVTLVQTVRAIEAGSTDADPWIAALAQNTDDIVAKIGALYGPDAASAFYQQWAQHTQFLADYAQAVRDGDDDAREAARTHLQSYASDSGHFFERITGSQLPAADVTALLTEHVGHIQAMVDALGDDDDETALAAAQTDNTYLSGIAQGLTTAFVAQHPDWFPGTVDGPVPVFCSLVTVTTGDYLLRQLFSPTPASTTDEAFAIAVGAAVTDVLGPVDGLSSPDAAVRVSTARTALDNAVAVGRAGADAP